MDNTYFSVKPKDLTPIEGLPFIFKEEVERNGMKFVIVLNLANRISYLIAKNEHCSLLVSADHIGFDSKNRKKKTSKNKPEEPETLRHIIARIGYYLDPECFNKDTTISSIAGMVTDLNYIECGEIKSIEKESICTTFDTLKNHTSDAATVLVLEKNMNGETI